MSGDVFEYAALRLVPRVDRGELINTGVVVYCKARSFVAVRTHLAEERLLALDPTVDLAGVRNALRAIEEMGAAEGQGDSEDPGQRFHRLTAPKSTVLQPGPVHTGLTTDPAAELDRLFDLLVRAPEAPR